MKKTLIILICFVLCAAVILTLGISLINVNKAKNAEQTAIDAVFTEHLTKFAQSMISSEQTHSTDEITRYLTNAKVNIHTAATLYELTSYAEKDTENLYTMLSSFEMLLNLGFLSKGVSEDILAGVLNLVYNAGTPEEMNAAAAEIVELLGNVSQKPAL